MNKKSIIIFVVGVILLGSLIVINNATNSESRVEKRLKTKLKSTAKEIFGTESWLNGSPKADTYIATLSDLKNKLGKDISLFEKYHCDENNTRVEFIVMEPTKPKQTNYKYNIILDCDF